MCLFAIWVFLGIQPSDLRWPFFRENDTYMYSRWLQGFLEHGSYYEIPELGAPFSARLYGYPLHDFLFVALASGLGFFTRDAYLVLNLLFLVSILWCAASAYWVLLRLGARPWPAFAAAVLFGFLPNHLARYEHLSLAFVVSAPGIVWVACELLAGRRLGLAAWCWAALGALVGAYPAFFSAGILLMGTVAGSYRHRSWTVLSEGLRATLLLCAVFAAVVVPPMLRTPPELGLLPQRHPEEIPMYALTVDRMTIPFAPRISHPLAALAARYHHAFPNPAGPRESAYLGWGACLGALCLLLALLSPRPPAAPQFLAWLALFMVGIGSASGLAPLLNQTVTSTIRCYNRVNFFLGFACLAGLALAMTSLRPRLARPLSVVLLLFGLWEQSRSLPPWEPERVKPEVLSTREFTRALEKMVPPHARIWQLPYTQFPETFQLFREGEYAWAKLYIASPTLHWSWGDLKGTWPDRLRKVCSELPLEQQLPILRRSAFAGIVVMRNALRDRGTLIDSQLAELGIRPTLVSPDRQFVFYPLPAPIPGRGFARDLLQQQFGSSPYEMTKGHSVGLILLNGWSEAEEVGTWTERSRALLRLPAAEGESTPQSWRFHVIPQLPPSGPQKVDVLAAGKQIARWTFSEQRPYAMDVDVPPGELLEWRIHTPTSPGSETRKLGVLLQKIEQITQVPRKDLGHSSL